MIGISDPRPSSSSRKLVKFFFFSFFNFIIYFAENLDYKKEFLLINQKLQKQSVMMDQLHNLLHSYHTIVAEIMAAKRREENNSSADLTSLDELFNFPLDSEEGLQLLEESLNRTTTEVKLVRNFILFYFN